MKNTPLAESEACKIIIFLLLMVPSVLLFVGILPVLLLAVGYFFAKKRNEFFGIEATVLAFNVYYALAILILLGWFVMQAITIVGGHHLTARLGGNGVLELTELFSKVMFFIAIIIGHILVIKHLYLVPLRKHGTWVVSMGMFTQPPEESSQEHQEFDYVY